MPESAKQPAKPCGGRTSRVLWLGGLCLTFAGILAVALGLSAGCEPLMRIRDLGASPYPYTQLSPGHQSDFMGFSGSAPSVMCVDVEDPGNSRIRATLRRSFHTDGETDINLYLGWQVLPERGITWYRGVQRGELATPYAVLRTTSDGWFGHKIDRIEIDRQVLGLRQKIVEKRKSWPPTRLAEVRLESVAVKGAEVRIRIRLLNAQGQDIFPEDTSSLFPWMRMNYGALEGTCYSGISPREEEGSGYLLADLDLRQHLDMEALELLRKKPDGPGLPSTIDRVTVLIGVEDGEYYAAIVGKLDLRLDPPMDTVPAIPRLK